MASDDSRQAQIRQIKTIFDVRIVVSDKTSIIKVFAVNGWIKIDDSEFRISMD